MPSASILAYYLTIPGSGGPPPPQSYDPAYPDLPKTEFRTSFTMFKKYKNLIPVIVNKS